MDINELEYAYMGRQIDIKDMIEKMQCGILCMLAFLYRHSPKIDEISFKTQSVLLKTNVEP